MKMVARMCVVQMIRHFEITGCIIVSEIWIIIICLNSFEKVLLDVRVMRNMIGRYCKPVCRPLFQSRLCQAEIGRLTA